MLARYRIIKERRIIKRRRIGPRSLVYIAFQDFLKLHFGYQPGTDDVLLFEVERVYETRLDCIVGRVVPA